MLSLSYYSFLRMLGFDCLFVLLVCIFLLFLKDKFIPKKKIEQVDLGLYVRPSWPRIFRDPFVSTS